MFNHIGAQMTAPHRIPAGNVGALKTTAQPVTLQPLADVALIDAAGIVAAACISISQWHELVKTGKAPLPAFRKPRCTRWKLVEVRAWLIEFAAQGACRAGHESAAALKATAIKASRAAQSKRAASTAAQAPQANGAAL